MPDKTAEERAQDTYDKVIQIWGALCGVPGTSDKGLLGKFEEHCKSDSEFRAEFYKFRRQCLAVFFFLLGTGALGVGVWQVPLMIGG